MLIDVTRCSGCYNCFLACRDEYYGNDYPGYSAAQPLNGQYWMQMKEIERGKYPRPRLDYIAIPCLHCENAPCIDAARTGRCTGARTGSCMIDPEKAKGQDQIVDSCPYRVIYWNEELQLPQKCTLCAHLLDTGDKQPRCVESCPTGALVFGDLDDPESEISKRMREVETEVFHPEYETGPLVVYAGLPGRMVAGEVVLEGSDVCAAGVKVTLEGDGVSLETASKTFGDFEFERLPQNKAFKVTVAADGYKPQMFDVKTHTDVDLGEVVLTR